MTAPGDVARIVLVGFMASGKSTVGRRLAERLGWDFIDFDEEIERRAGRSIGDIFRQDGEAAFRALEAKLTAEWRNAESVVLAPGGGWVTQPGLLDSLGPRSVVVWLRISAAEAVRRTASAQVHRPLLAGADPLATAERLLRQREPLYRRADVVVDSDARGPDELASAILREISGRES